MRLQNRIAVVTGASRGIGRAIALAFAADGAHVAVVARSKSALIELAALIAASGRDGFPVAVDFGNAAEIPNVVSTILERFGRIDILVNNAAIIHPRIDLVDFDPALWRSVIDVNLTAPALLTKAVLPS
ncbi:MAG: SDR family NAD(P)-dependent oxidoreductase, partial [Burkholderiales bacterium]